MTGFDPSPTTVTTPEEKVHALDGFARTQLAAFHYFLRVTAKTWQGLRLLLAVGAVLPAISSVRGQSALDGFDPNANGTVNVVVAQPDGKILLGGSFTSVLYGGGVRVTVLPG